MPYELTINRVMALCAAANLARPNEPIANGMLIAKFRKQMSIMAGEKLENMYATVVAAAKDNSDRIENAPAAALSDNEEKEIEVFVMPKDSPNAPKNLSHPPSEHIVGLFPSRMFTLDTGGLKWLLRVRPSVTACALERPDGLSKLWWSFEGIAADPQRDRRPSESEAVAFLAATSAMAEVSLLSLRDTYRYGLEGVTGGSKAALDLLPQRIKINLADNNGSPFAALIDAMNLRGASFSEAKDASKFDKEVVGGAEEVSQFVHHVTDRRAPDESIALNTDLPRMKAVIYKFQDEKASSDEKEIVLAGLARSAGMRAGYEARGEFRRIEYEPRNLRTMSAARPLSARLAMKHALVLDSELSSKVAKAVPA
ncbi:MAG: hypothetical protein ACHQRJ_16500 [Alphaproteobacteria bacterium]